MRTSPNEWVFVVASNGREQSIFQHGKSPCTHTGDAHYLRVEVPQQSMHPLPNRSIIIETTEATDEGATSEDAKRRPPNTLASVHTIPAT
jgi:hypothetical protein